MSIKAKSPNLNVKKEKSEQRLRAFGDNTQQDRPDEFDGVGKLIITDTQKDRLCCVDTASFFIEPVN